MLRVTHSCGFFSNCNIRLQEIIRYFDINKKLPITVDSSEQYGWYKPNNNSDDITFDYFNNYDNVKIDIEWKDTIDYTELYQYSDYKTLNYESIIPFVTKYFTPSLDIIDRVNILERKYNITNYENICVLFYRGNDKITETNICGYNEVIEKAEQILENNSDIKFLIQSDETEFIETMLERFPNSLCFKDEIRHMKKQTNTVDKVFKHLNSEYSKYYFAITLIMAKCNHIIFTSGNCSIWIMFFRGHADNVYQYLHDRWV